MLQTRNHPSRCLALPFHVCRHEFGPPGVWSCPFVCADTETGLPVSARVVVWFAASKVNLQVLPVLQFLYDREHFTIPETMV